MDLFPEHRTKPVAIAAGACWLPGFALSVMPTLWQMLQQHLAAHPAQQMMTPMGLMSVATSSMGHWGWVGSSQGYGYLAYDPVTGQPWPAIPPVILQLAANAAAQAGYSDFVPDSCLINIYQAGSKMGLHQDKDEQDFSQPIVSVSLGIPATFLFGGAKRNDASAKIPLQHGDIVVWGGESRRFYHGVAAIGAHQHPLTGNKRINLTLRKAK
ncbi:DNA oxidative demethylase AlkB [Methylophilus sp. OH31]|uniref:DNA oxidative demethylase AlkB n=1 Tax=Methylophilus sp. OH31 TaxID=1387312 RepID=UPI000467767D|nr:DNA oxidative demethylase AlkB [Methylophilus sp. OH31]